MNKKFFAFIVLAAALPAAAHADKLQMSGSGTSSMAPHKGQTMAQVVKQFGEPQTKHAPVGGSNEKQPPITRWDYPGYSVFFEHSHVVDSVVPDMRPEVQHTDKLKAQ
jgi:hypothetical protein